MIAEVNSAGEGNQSSQPTHTGGGLTIETISDEETGRREIDLAEVQPALEYFDITPNVCKKHEIVPRGSFSMPWASLTQLETVEWNGIVYKPGDIIYLLLASSGSNMAEYAIAELCEIRSLGDGRSVILIFWYMHLDEARLLIPRRDTGRLLTEWKYIKTTHMQTVMWDCAAGKLSDEDVQSMCFEQILDMSVRPYRIRKRNANAVRWAKQPQSTVQ